MKIYEEVIKDLDGLLKFVKDNDLNFDCNFCRKYGLECNYGDCNNNLIKYLQMDKIEENIPKNEISMDEFIKFISEIRVLAGRINNMDTYTEVNYIRNHIKGLEDEGIIFNDNQKQLLSEEFRRIESGINHLKSLKSTIDKYK
ncbi:hypothetical protein [Terrisporobacter sp.]|uniref:hypothetical protein n=1 Tax=Terrisporobacter sp. TaxID=1965305 RepID=UPI002634657C|nr:hypothetical protein [Terrisporobacter sp.]